MERLYDEYIDYWQLREDFEKVIIKHTTKKQKREALKLTDDLLFIVYLASAYNCYVITHSEVSMSMITNPDALFRSEIVNSFFIGELKEHIRDALLTTKKVRAKDVKDGETRTQGENTQNS